jgi:hypothetical protein
LALISALEISTPTLLIQLIRASVFFSKKCGFVLIFVAFVPLLLPLLFIVVVFLSLLFWQLRALFLYLLVLPSSIKVC